MNALFISTFNELVIIGLISNNKLITKYEVKSNKSHSINLVPTIIKVLNESNYQISQINEIIVVNGPGSFTGVRLGVTVAKTLSYTLKINIKTITSIEAVALSNKISKAVVTIPDNKGIYYGIFKNNKLIDSISYLNNDNFNDFIMDYNEYKIIDNQEINILNIYQYLKDKQGVNPHSVKPVYIKEIEVLNGK